MRMREGLKFYMGKRHEDTGKRLKFLLTFCKRSKIRLRLRMVRCPPRSSMRMREDFKIYTGKRHEDTGKPSKILVTFCKCSKISVTFAHVRNQIQKVDLKIPVR